jgi:hypothetical protein
VIGVCAGLGVLVAMALTTGALVVVSISVAVATSLSMSEEVQDIIASIVIDKTMYDDAYRFPPIVTLPSSFY